MRRLAGSGWGAGAETLRTAALALVYSTAEYCAPTWGRSAHTRLIDTTINDALRIVTGCLRPTPTEYLPMLAGIQPAELRRSSATLSLACRALEPLHLLHQKLETPVNGQRQRLKSRHPFVPAAQELLRKSSHLDTNAAQWADHTWSADWQSSSTRLHAFVPDASTKPAGMTLPRPSWIRLNCLRTDV